MIFVNFWVHCKMRRASLKQSSKWMSWFVLFRVNKSSIRSSSLRLSNKLGVSRSSFPLFVHFVNTFITILAICVCLSIWHTFSAKSALYYLINFVAVVLNLNYDYNLHDLYPKGLAWWSRLGSWDLHVYSLLKSWIRNLPSAMNSFEASPYKALPRLQLHNLQY